jgi:hypothetical protein
MPARNRFHEGEAAENDVSFRKCEVLRGLVDIWLRRRLFPLPENTSPLPALAIGGVSFHTFFPERERWPAFQG